ncbi:MAG: hypothetical protein MUO26_15430 [Methanotrichaceae archaeon]|nr:hypothetical protein [Methanotrichaceae archaeon]
MIVILNRLKEEACFTIVQALKVSGIKIYSIPARVKSAESFLDKVQRKEPRNPFEEIQDIVGLRIVCLFLSDINKIGEIIRDSFDIISMDNKIESTDYSSFGYLSIHYIVKFKKEHSGPRYDEIKELPFEIQVRTLAMDAWANISHYLEYKSELDIPKELKRDFYALSGLFYVADKHFEMFFKSREEVTRQLEASEIKPEEEINLDNLIVYLKKRFPDRKHSSLDEVSGLINQLADSGYRFIKNIEHVLDVSRDAFAAYEKDFPPMGEAGRRYADIGVIRTSLTILDDTYRHKFTSFIPGSRVEKYKRLLKKD